MAVKNCKWQAHFSLGNLLQLCEQNLGLLLSDRSNILVLVGFEHFSDIDNLKGAEIVIKLEGVDVIYHFKEGFLCTIIKNIYVVIRLIPVKVS